MLTLASLAISFLNLFLHAFVLTHLWRWFVAPLGLPSIGMAQAYGLSLLIGWLTFHMVTAPPKTTGEQKIEAALFRGALLLMVWGSGYVAHELMA